ncbi:outer membrane beta-barrel protein [Hymenobacter rubripertinctus]|uniref:Outer membrane protein beta-barrel domain-containing protein n=1 Tax=Hymenobacter rubripertinctus TaxID=2029981 RepID=A0A418QSD4_9BACT|nr:outer membrane beta-barrel protein [Hymenobacter rubripertinctus]RIY08185.1 hypothetical protein D0T11_14860 [Hymenobacter rubripertinctus]
MKIILIVIMTLVSICSRAQDSGDSKLLHKYHLTVSRGYSVYEVFYDSRSGIQPSVISFGPWQLGVGVNVSNRLSMETGLLYSKQHSESIAQGTGLNGMPIAERLKSNSQAIGMPIKFRYAIRRNAKSRFQADVIGSISFVRQQADSEFTRTEGVDVLDYYYKQGESSDFYVTAGLSGRYLLWKHLEIVGELSFNHILKDLPSEVHTNVIGNPTGLTENHKIGLRYNFNFKLPKR